MAFRLTVRARRDLDAVLGFSLEKRGRDAAARYQLLLTTAMEAVGNHPLLLGSRPVEDNPDLRVYAIAYSRMRLPRSQRVARPVHQLVYRVAADGVVEILAVIGDSYPATRLDPPP